MKKKIIFTSVVVFLLFGLFVVNYFLTNQQNSEINVDLNQSEIKGVKNTNNEIKIELNDYVCIYIYGEIKRSGFYRVPTEWTLYDLIKMVGVTDNSDLTSINLATQITDGKTYYISSLVNESESRQDSTSNTDNNSDLININLASKSELMSINGIGSVIADRIIEYRNTSVFNSIEDLKNVEGIGTVNFEKIKGFITV